MKRERVEISVGIFVLIGLVCVGYLVIKLGKMEIFGNDHYNVKARFTSVSGLRPGAPVEMAGVQIGDVREITLDEEDMVAAVTFRIKEGIRLSDDVIASVKTSGLIGDKYIDISPGGSEDFIEDGGVIVNTEPAVDIGDLIGKYAFGSVK